MTPVREAVEKSTFLWAIPESLCVSCNSLSFKQSCNINRKSINTCTHTPKLSLCLKNKRHRRRKTSICSIFTSIFNLKGHFFRVNSLPCRSNSNYLGAGETLHSRFPFSSPSAQTIVLLPAQHLSFVTQFMRWLKICPQEYFRTPLCPTHLHCLRNASPGTLISAQRALPSLSPWTVLHRKKANTQVLKHYFKHHQLLRSRGESTQKAGTQRSRNGFYFRKLNHATSKSRETTFSHFLTWPKSDQVGSWSVGYSQLEFISGLSPKTTELTIG